jgi:hypothetical protein
MNNLLCFILSLSLNFNLFSAIRPTEKPLPPLIDAYILAYDAIYNGDNQPKKNFIILDMESNYFVDTTYEERQKAINHFSKYNKPVLSASLFKLKEIGLANKRDSIIINGDLLMMTHVYSEDAVSIVIEGSKYCSETCAYSYRVKLNINSGSWQIEKIEELGVA